MSRKQKSSPTVPMQHRENGFITFYQDDIEDSLKSYFAEVSGSSCLLSNHLLVVLQVVCLFFININLCLAYKHLNWLNASITIGARNINPCILKKFTEVLASNQTTIFENSLTSVRISNNLKEDAINPVYKGGNRHTPAKFDYLCLNCIQC